MPGREDKIKRWLKIEKYLHVVCINVTKFISTVNVLSILNTDYNTVWIISMTVML